MVVTVVVELTVNPIRDKPYSVIEFVHRTVDTDLDKELQYLIFQFLFVVNWRKANRVCIT